MISALSAPVSQNSELSPSKVLNTAHQLASIMQDLKQPIPMRAIDHQFAVQPGINGEFSFQELVPAMPRGLDVAHQFLVPAPNANPEQIGSNALKSINTYVREIAAAGSVFLAAQLAKSFLEMPEASLPIVPSSQKQPALEIRRLAQDKEASPCITCFLKVNDEAALPGIKKANFIFRNKSGHLQFEELSINHTSTHSLLDANGLDSVLEFKLLAKLWEAQKALSTLGLATIYTHQKA